MSTFGCHNCGFNVKDYENKPFEEWPCAHCALSKDYSHTFSTGFFDTGALEEMEDEHGVEVDDHFFVTSGAIPLRDDEIHSLETIRDAVVKQTLATFSGVMIKLLKMAKKNPVMFEVLIKKMQFPYMSYSDIGDTMDPKCSKQNVLYHLKSAIEELPELGAVISTDTRYSSGHYALKTLADKHREEAAEKRVQQIIYGDKYFIGRYMNMDELNAILRLPFTLRDEIFSFNAYLKDEEHVDRSAEDKDKQ